MSLEKCTACDGFVPAAASACPHCSAKRSKIRGVAAVVGSGAIAFTLMACYGAAPCPEGGTACHKTTPSTDSSSMPTSSIAPPSAPMPGVDAGK